MARKTFIDDTAIVHPTAEIGDGSMIWNWTKIRERAVLGIDCNIGQSVYVDFETRIGDRCKIQNGVSVYHGVTIGNDVFVGPNATFTNDLRPRAHAEDWEITETIVEDGASVGANSTIVCGVTLGRHCMVGAGAVVTADVPPHALVLGCPARVVDYVTVAGHRLHVPPADGLPDPDRLNDKKIQGS